MISFLDTAISDRIKASCPGDASLTVKLLDQSDSSGSTVLRYGVNLTPLWEMPGNDPSKKDLMKIRLYSWGSYLLNLIHAHTLSLGYTEMARWNNYPHFSETAPWKRDYWLHLKTRNPQTGKMFKVAMFVSIMPPAQKEETAMIHPLATKFGYTISSVYIDKCKVVIEPGDCKITPNDTLLQYHIKVTPVAQIFSGTDPVAYMKRALRDWINTVQLRVRASTRELGYLYNQLQHIEVTLDNVTPEGVDIVASMNHVDFRSVAGTKFTVKVSAQCHVRHKTEATPQEQKKSCSGQCGSCQCKSAEQKSPLPERDTSKSAEEQGLFEKFVVIRRDGSDALGGKHHGCEYFVLDLNHDPHAKAALQAYADACEQTHPQLAADIRSRYGVEVCPDKTLKRISDAIIAAREAHPLTIINSLTHMEDSSNDTPKDHGVVLDRAAMYKLNAKKGDYCRLVGTKFKFKRIFDGKGWYVVDERLPSAHTNVKSIAVGVNPTTTTQMVGAVYAAMKSPPYIIQTPTGPYDTRFPMFGGVDIYKDAGAGGSYIPELGACGGAGGSAATTSSNGGSGSTAGLYAANADKAPGSETTIKGPSVTNQLSDSKSVVDPTFATPEHHRKMVQSTERGQSTQGPTHTASQ